MAIHLQDNQYRGINAHAHSYLQRYDEWEIFHREHNTHLREAFQELLPPGSGYFAVLERSLQISSFDPDLDKIERTRTKPDISIYRSTSVQSAAQGRRHAVSNAASPTATIPLQITFDEIEYFPSVIIFQAREDSLLGKPITRVELLSPANKPSGSHHKQYLGKREETLKSGINVIELDYLHEKPFPVAAVPSYPNHDESAYPYTILVNVPEPSISKGRAEIYGFRVDDPIPTIEVPLADEDSVVVDFNAVYQHTFAANNVYGMLIVDYEKLPEGFETYDEEDQRRIKARMEAVAEAQRQQ
jgi:hypothetical protein